MSDPTKDLQSLRTSLHDMNNRVGVILATAEMLQLQQLDTKALERARLIEQKSLELRGILRSIGERFFP